MCAVQDYTYLRESGIGFLENVFSVCYLNTPLVFSVPRFKKLDDDKEKTLDTCCACDLNDDLFNLGHAFFCSSGGSIVAGEVGRHDQAGPGLHSHGPVQYA